jgi:hypothetical protein
MNFIDFFGYAIETLSDFISDKEICPNTYVMGVATD